MNGISSTHIEKLGHELKEIRLRTLDNIISKLEHGFRCDCDSVRCELLSKIFNLFAFDDAVELEDTEKILDLIHSLILNNEIKVSNYGIKRFKRELEELRIKLDPILHNNKLDEIVEAASSQQELITISTNESCLTLYNDCKNVNGQIDDDDRCFHLNSSIKTNVTMAIESESLGSKVSTDCPIKWLIMPWQSLVSSDRGVLSAIEEALNTTNDDNLIIRTCQFIKNIMLQDFPAEVFLQRPSIILILETHLTLCTGNFDVDTAWQIIPTVISVFYKLTKSLRFKLNYYCDPTITSFKNKNNGDYLKLSNDRDRDSFDAGLPTFNYQAYQSAANSDHSQSSNTNTNTNTNTDVDTDDTLLKLQQMLIPTYCIDTLNHTLKLLSIPVSSIRPLNNIKYIVDLVSELVELLTQCIMPSIWLYSDSLSKNIQENLSNLMNLFGEILEYLRSFNTMDYFRVTYLQLLSIITKLLSCLVPLEIADFILPNTLKISITISLMDAPIYLIYPELNNLLEKYSRNFKSPDEIECIKLFDETCFIIKSMKSAIKILKNNKLNYTPKILKIMFQSKLSLAYHKNLNIIKKYILLFQNIYQPLFNEEDKNLVTKFLLYLLANENNDIRYQVYQELHSLITVNLNTNNNNWMSILFLFDTNIWTEIISFGVNNNKNKKIKNLAREILLLLINGKNKMDENGWTTFLNSFVPVLPLLQCFADVSTSFGKAISKMLDPDIYHDIKLTYSEVINGNIRLLYSLDNNIREEALYRLLYLLEIEKNSTNKLPKLNSLHGLPLNSLFIFERKLNMKILESNYQTSNLLSTLEMLKINEIEPKIKKSALVQISLMLNDSSLHQLFLKEKGLKLIINILNRSLIENDYEYYPDSVIPVLTIFKLLLTNNINIRHELLDNDDSNIIINILRSVYLFPNNENVKSDSAYLLFILLFSNYIIELNDEGNISIPNVISENIYTPILTKTHWKLSPNCQYDSSTNYMNNEIGLIFIRQYWAWYWNSNNSKVDDDDDDGSDNNIFLLDNEFQLENINSKDINSKLMIRKIEIDCLKYTCINYYCKQQLSNIDNSKTHVDVTCSLDYLWMYIKLYERYKRLGFIKSLISLTSMPWAHSFDRFLISHPTNKEDCDLFVDVLNFLYVLINLTKDYDNNINEWLIKIMKNITKSLTNLYQNLDNNNNHQNIYQSILKLVRLCSNYINVNDDENNFTELIITNLLSLGDEQHFYNLVYLDWLLTCLINLTNNYELNCNKDLLKSLGNLLIELIISFHANGSISFMGLSITRNSIICLNHLLYHFEKCLNKTKEWITYWYDDGKTLNWLKLLWKNRDPLVRASALQFLSGLIKTPHNLQQLLHSLIISTDKLCQVFIEFIIDHNESCIVREQATITLTYFIKNINNQTFDYNDFIKSNDVMCFIEKFKVYYELGLLINNIYLPSTLDSNNKLDNNVNHFNEDDMFQSKVSLFPRNILEYYNCPDELLILSNKNSIDDDNNFNYNDNDNDNLTNNHQQYLSTPSLITSLCKLLNNLIIIGELDVIKKIYQHSLDKYLINSIQPIESIVIDGNEYYDILEMYIDIFKLLNNCISNCYEFANVVKFSPDFLYIIFNYLNENNYSQKLNDLKDKFWIEIYHLISLLSLTHNQHTESLKIAIEISNFKMIFKSINNSINNSTRQLRMNAIASLGFLLSLEMNKIDEMNNQLGTIFDSTFIELSSNNSNANTNPNKNNDDYDDDDDDDDDGDSDGDGDGVKSIDNIGQILSDVNKLTMNDLHNNLYKKYQSDENNSTSETGISVGSLVSKTLIQLFIAHNYVKSKKTIRKLKDKELIIATLTNLLCVSYRAKKTAIDENLSGTCIILLKDIHNQLNLQQFNIISYHIHKTNSERDKKIHPLLIDINQILTLLMNFSYNSLIVKRLLSESGVADILHKLWAWISLNDSVLITSLKLMATLTTNCPEGAQSLALTTTLPGAALRKTPNNVSLIHVIIHLISKEIDKVAVSFNDSNNEKLRLAFHVLKNSIRVHECRVSIAKSNLLQFLTKIHPASTKRTKPWLIVETYCLQFLTDFTFYEEGQLSVSKAVDGLDVLIQLSKCNTPAIRILALSTLRNLVFNLSNRPRILCSVEFTNLLHSTFKLGSLNEVSVAGSMFLSLIANNQKGKLMARTSGLKNSIQSVLGRLTLVDNLNEKQEKDLVSMLQYLLESF